MKEMDRRQFFRAAGFALAAVWMGGCIRKTSLLAVTPQASPTGTSKPQPTVQPINLENRYIAYCGNDCKRCPQYDNGCQGGCLGENCSMACSSCSVRRCAIRNKVANCAKCGKYPCKTLETQYENMKSDGYASWAKMARAVLDTVKGSE